MEYWTSVANQHSEYRLAPAHPGLPSTPQSAERIADAVRIAPRVERDAVPVRRGAQITTEIVGGEPDSAGVLVPLRASKDHVLNDVGQAPGVIVLMDRAATQLHEDVAAGVVQQRRRHDGDAVVEPGGGKGDASQRWQGHAVHRVGASATACARPAAAHMATTTGGIGARK